MTAPTPRGGTRLRDANVAARINISQSDGPDGRYSKIYIRTPDGGQRTVIELSAEELGRLLQGQHVDATLRAWWVETTQ